MKGRSPSRVAEGEGYPDRFLSNNLPLPWETSPELSTEPTEYIKKNNYETVLPLACLSVSLSHSPSSSFPFHLIH